jgi:phosphatidylethanolamine-binding protein (PEBP) family uncharacterized protein
MDRSARRHAICAICHDYDVPSRADDVNQENREVPASLPRVDCFHWVLPDIPAPQQPRDAPRQTGPVAPYGLRHGINDCTSWVAKDPDMRGDYYGYDGPCPPLKSSNYFVLCEFSELPDEFSSEGHSEHIDRSQ